MHLSKAEKPFFTEFILFAKPSVGLAPTTAEKKEKKAKINSVAPILRRLRGLPVKGR
nr:MAG TPA: hypothetical protein [Caudoviricetes sp.]